MSLVIINQRYQKFMTEGGDASVWEVGVSGDLDVITLYMST